MRVIVARRLDLGAHRRAHLLGRQRLLALLREIRRCVGLREHAIDRHPRGAFATASRASENRSNRRRQDRRQRIARPLPAMSGRCRGSACEPEDRRRRRRPCGASQATRTAEEDHRAGQHRRLVGEDVAEHVLGDDDVEVPADGGSGASPSRRPERPRRERPRSSPRPRARPRATDATSSSTFALSTDVTFFLRPRARVERSLHDAANFLLAVDQRVDRLATGRSLPALARLAEVDAAGELADDEDVDAAHDLGLQRRRVEQRLDRLHRTEVREQAERLPDGEQRLLRDARSTSGRPTSDHRPRRAAPRQRRDASVASGSSLPVSSIARPPMIASSISSEVRSASRPCGARPPRS